MTSQPSADSPDDTTAPAATQEQCLALAEVVLSLSRALSHLGKTEAGIDDLSPVEALAVRQIAREPGTRPSHLAAGLRLSASNASTTLRQLEERGFIERHLDPDDARGVRIYLTPQASDNIAQKRSIWARILRGYLDPGTATEGLATTLSVLEHLDGRLHGATRHGATPPTT